MEKLQPELPERENSLKIMTEYLGKESSAVYSGSGIKLLEAASREQEIRTVLRSVKKLLQKGIKSSEIIILLRDFSFYAGLRNLSDEYGIPVSLPLTAKLNNEPLTEFMYLLVKTAAYSASAAAAGNLCTLMGCQAVKMLFEFDTELLLRLKTEKLYQSADSFVADGMEVLKDEEQQELKRLLD